VRAVVVNEYEEAPIVAEVPTPQPGPGGPGSDQADSGGNEPDGPHARQRGLALDAGDLSDGARCRRRRYRRQPRRGPGSVSAGDNVFGQLLIAPLGSAGTYAQYVAVSEDAPLALVPDRLDLVVAAALPSAGMTALSIVEDVLGALTGKIVTTRPVTTARVTLTLPPRQKASNPTG
jgi:NADPH2:quinone reductase